jgi:hypothetical protein
VPNGPSYGEGTDVSSPSVLENIVPIHASVCVGINVRLLIYLPILIRVIIFKEPVCFAIALLILCHYGLHLGLVNNGTLIVDNNTYMY